MPTPPKVVRVVEHPVPWQENGPWLLPMETGVQHVIRIQREVIPIIFIPGIMGSRLVNRASGELVWDPESSLGMWWNYSGLSAAGRHQRLIGGPRYSPTFLDVKRNAPEWSIRPSGPRDSVPSLAGRGGRGFEGVRLASYRDILTALYARERGVGGRWSDGVSRCFRLPVYACGYNWTASCRASGRDLARRVKKLIADYAATGQACRYAILVTHSMGGLVARAAMKSDAAFKAKLLGVVHGVQPVTGSGAAYWRMKAGFEEAGATANVLGPSAAEVTAILAHMPGGLQLLPSKAYTNNEGSSTWLHVAAPGQPQRPVLSLPTGSDPYASIYKERRRFWRLVDPTHLRPGGGGGGPTSPTATASGAPATPWAEYERVLGQAEAFHDWLADEKHDRTRTFYGTGTAHPTAANVIYDPARRIDLLTLQGWLPDEAATAQQALIGARAPGPLSPVYTNSGYRAWVEVGTNQRLGFTLRRPGGRGDGTVPESSGRALAVPTTTAMPAQPRREAFTPLQLGLEGIDHEGAYGDNWIGTSNSHTFVLRSIEALCQDFILREAGPG